jgi:hypothetical protein
MPSSLLQVVNSLFQTCYSNWEQAVRTHNLSTACGQICNLFAALYTRADLSKNYRYRLTEKNVRVSDFIIVIQ